MKDLVAVSVEEQRNFINSFDVVLSDLDGVIWVGYQPLPGATVCVESLKRLGKKCYYVTNNSCVPMEDLLNRLNEKGFPTKLSNVASPVLAIISYLKNINFNKQIFTITTKYFRETLEQAGFLLADEAPTQIEDSFEILYTHLNDNKNVGAVIMDLDINLNFVKLQMAVTYLRRNDCLFIVGAGDQKFPSTKFGDIIGTQYFMQILEDFSGKKPYIIGKPNKNFNAFVTEQFNIKNLNPNRVLYIGDSINEDLKFATSCGYQKLLVLTGITTKMDVEDWKYLDEYKPQYYVDNLSVLDGILKNVFRRSMSISTIEDTKLGLYTCAIT